MAALLAVLAALLSSDMASASRMEAMRKMIVARSLEAQGLPDPKCHTGVLSLATNAEPQVCCAGYCGECSDYPTCMSVRGQNSTFACCKSQVSSMQCGKGTPANICLKSCSEAVPPCIMDSGEVFTTPDPSTRHAGQDCNKAVQDWRARVAVATDPSTVAAGPATTASTASPATTPMTTTTKPPSYHLLMVGKDMKWNSASLRFEDDQGNSVQLKSEEDAVGLLDGTFTEAVEGTWTQDSGHVSDVKLRPDGTVSDMYDMGFANYEIQKEA